MKTTQPEQLEIKSWYSKNSEADEDKWLDIVRKYYNDKAVFLTPDIARSLIGETVGVIWGQWWPNSVKDFDMKSKINNIANMKIISQSSPENFDIYMTDEDTNRNYQLQDTLHNNKLYIGYWDDQPIYVFKRK